MYIRSSGFGHDLIAAEENRHPNLTSQLAERGITGRVVTEREWRGRLGPDDVFRAAADRIAGHRKIGREDPAGRLRGRRHLVCLRDIALYQPHANGRPFARQRSLGNTPRTPGRDANQQNRSCDGGRHRDAARAEQGKRDRRVDERDERRETIHAEHARHLCHSQNGDLAVTERNPRKTAEQ